MTKNVDTTLVDGAPLTSPDMTARSGATPSSAGAPKLTMKTDAGSRPAPPPAPPPPVTQHEIEEAEEDPFGNVAVVEEATIDRAEVEAMLATTREVIASIEMALDKARAQERLLRDKLARL